MQTKNLKGDLLAWQAYYQNGNLSTDEQLFPDWSGHHLRTTSRLERFNRTIRFRLKAANAYHSDAGLQAMMAQETHAFNHAQALN